MIHGAQDISDRHYSPTILTSTLFRRRPSNSPLKICSQVPKSKRPLATATTTAERGDCCDRPRPAQSQPNPTSAAENESWCRSPCHVSAKLGPWPDTHHQRVPAIVGRFAVALLLRSEVFGADGRSVPALPVPVCLTGSYCLIAPSARCFSTRSVFGCITKLPNSFVTRALNVLSIPGL